MGSGGSSGSAGCESRFVTKRDDHPCASTGRLLLSRNPCKQVEGWQCDPHHRPASLAGSPAPRVHAATKAARKAFYGAYAWFVAAFRRAAEKLRQGELFDSRTARRRANFPSFELAWGEVSPDQPVRLGERPLRPALWRSGAVRRVDSERSAY
jgi:hypothetical protein